MKFQAPDGVSGIGIQSGRHLSCEPGGIIIAPDDLTDDEAASIARAGFALMPDDVTPAKQARTPPVVAD